jgi:histone deacetylase 1/2
MDDEDDDLDEIAAAAADIKLEEMLDGLEEPDPPLLNRRARRDNMRKPARFIVNHISLRRGLSLYGVDAERSIQQEILNMINKDVFIPVRITSLSSEERRRIIRSSIFLKEKFKANGTFDKLKARLVADGSMQERSVYATDELSSPTVATISVMCMLAIAAKERRSLSTVDIGSAYLNAEMDADVIMMLDTPLATIIVAIWPELLGYLDDRGRAYVRLKKALYGCIESAKLWYEELKRTLESWGYVANNEDKCVFNKLVNGVQSTLLLHVDDILCLSASAAAHEELLRRATERFKEVHHDAGVSLSFLGMTVDMRVQSEARLSMQGFINDLIREYDCEGRAMTPANSNLFSISASAVMLGFVRKKRFHSFVAKSLYLGKRIRPDILVAVSFLCTRVTKATEEDELKLDRLIQYVSATRNQPLILSASDQVSVIAYVDASYGVHDDGKSHTGAVITLGAGAIYARSSKQHIVTKSSTEAELVAITDTLGEIVWIRRFVIEQGYVVPPVILFQDNMSTIALCNRGGAGHRTKHIKIRNFFIKEHIDEGEVAVAHKWTGEMVADLETKPLQGATFRYLRDVLVNCASEDVIVT